MNEAKNRDCPNQNILLDFIQGKLAPPTLGDCEAHLSECESCHETLRGLDANDTLSHYVSEALVENIGDEQGSDTQAIAGLMQRLLQPNRNRLPSIVESPAEAEIMADRAAEVLRCIEPPAIGDEESLGSLGDYQLLRLIGAGGTGVVFQARDCSLDRIVALKVLRPSLGALARDRFIAEARLAASIEHDNIVTIYQIGQQDRLAFIAMQWIPGETLESRLIRESALLPESVTREFIVQIAAGLSAAHQRQLIHRDIKPANIWICEGSDRIKILDFGLARVTDEETNFTQTGMLAGTPNFMSPEQTRGMELDPRSDLFSLGCVMYQMLTGKLPFSAPTILATLQTIQTETPRPPIAIKPECSQDMSDLAMGLLEKLPGNRLSSADSLIQCLENNRDQWPESVAVLSGEATDASSSTAQPMLATTRSSFAGIRWLIAASLLGVLGFAGWLAAPQIIRIATDQGELVIETNDENVKVEILKNNTVVRTVDTSTGESLSFDIKSGEYVFKAKKDGGKSAFEVTPHKVTMTRGGKMVVSVAKSNIVKLAAKDAASTDRAKTDASTTATDKSQRPIYGGRNFDEWLHIATNDREPKSATDALRACAVLASGSEKEEFLKLLRKQVRKHGGYFQTHLTGESNETYSKGFLKTLEQLTGEEIWSFIQFEVESGNERSIGFCQTITNNVFINDVRRRRSFENATNCDLSPLFERIIDKEIEWEDGIIQFCRSLIFRRDANFNVSQLTLAIEAAHGERKPVLYGNFVTCFRNGEIDEQIEQFFVAHSTPATVREGLLTNLRKLVSDQGLSIGGRNFLTQKNQPKLLWRLINRAVATFEGSQRPMQFEELSHVWFDNIGVIETRIDHGTREWFDHKSGLTGKAPDGAEHVDGQSAVIRNLLTELCETVVAYHFDTRSAESLDSRLIVTLLRQFSESIENFDDNELAKLKISEDITALSNFLNEKQLKFSRFLDLSRFPKPKSKIAEFNGRPPIEITAVDKPSSKIYGGRTFDDWFYIAKNDSEPKTVSEAIAACAILANDNQKLQVKRTLQQLMRAHGSEGCDLNTMSSRTDKDWYYKGFVRTLSQFEPKEVIDFIQEEIESGNSKSLGACSGLLNDCFMINDYVGEEAKEFQASRRFDVSPLLTRLIQNEIEFNQGIRFFLDSLLFSAKTEVSLELSKKFIESIDIEERFWQYETFSNRFTNGELHDNIRRDFFADSTPGAVRERYLEMLLPPRYVNHIRVDYKHRELSCHLIIESIEKVISDKNLKLEEFNDFLFDSEGEIQKFTNQTFGGTRYRDSRGSTFSEPPKDSVRIEGKLAKLRHLMTKLCLCVNNCKTEQEKKSARQVIQKWIQELDQSNEKWKKLKSTEQFQDVQVLEDISSLKKFAKGEEFEFSKFISKQNSGVHRGGIGGGGVF